jgi:hypothetical protein
LRFSGSIHAWLSQENHKGLGEPSARLREMLVSAARNMEQAYHAGAALGFGTDRTVGLEQYETGIEFIYSLLDGKADEEMQVMCRKPLLVLLGGKRAY